MAVLNRAIQYKNNNNMNEALRTRIDEHCQMVKCGVKPLSLLTYQARYHEEVINIIKDYDLYYSSEPNGKGWLTIYIYKNKAIGFLIPELPKTPKKPIEHALVGLFLGYGIDSICEFIFKKYNLF